MRTKSINEMADQYRRISYYALKRGWYWISNCKDRYRDNMQEYMGMPRGWRVRPYTKKEMATPVPYEVYTR